MNFNLGCYGCREATNLEPGETVLGFPGSDWSVWSERCSMLRARAIPRSRAKLAHECLAGSGTEGSHVALHCCRVDHAARLRAPSTSAKGWERGDRASQDVHDLHERFSSPEQLTSLISRWFVHRQEPGDVQTLKQIVNFNAYVGCLSLDTLARPVVHRAARRSVGSVRRHDQGATERLPNPRSQPT